MNRVFVLPSAPRPLGLLMRASQGQVDFAGPIGAMSQQWQQQQQWFAQGNCAQGNCAMQHLQDGCYG